MSKKVLIIGGGAYGLAAGAYLAMNGFDTEIYEMHNLPGGVCTCWSRKGYTFDFCIHWLMGSSPGKSLYHVWSELGAVQGRKMIESDIYMKWDNRKGDTFTVYTDPEKLRAEMLRLGPDDKRLIDKMINGIIAFSKFDMPGRSEDENFGLIFKMIGMMPKLMKWGGMTVTKFADKLKSPALSQFFHEMYGSGGMGDFPMMGMMMMLGFMAVKSNGYPMGGSLKFAQAIEATFKKNGGRMFYNSKADKIIVEDGKAVGIIVNGKEIRGDYVISAADGYATFNTLLGGKYPHPKHDNAYKNWKTFPSLVFVSLGLARKFENMPSTHNFNSKNPLVIEDGKSTLDYIHIRLFNFDDTMAPAGKTAITSMVNSFNYQYWVDLKKKDPAKYEAEKKRIADWIIDESEQYFGDFKSKVEVVDVATPETIIRYTGNWQGSYEGWLPDKNTMMKQLPSKLPGLANFYMLGQWVSPGGGLPPAGMNGRKLAQAICKKEKQKFTVK
ncbi:MAG: NAD(P)/FAD-dependent oxidoreductase [Brevinematales bacterium]|nr:NAD(P)/FAD-dependent oxidoreductase [Brevinematales bacterium]